MSEKVRKASVAGQFYPATPELIQDSIKTYMDKVDQKDLNINKLYGIISPHAGYPYSGEIAAYGYDLIARYKSKKYVVIAPSHREYINGFSVYPGDSYETPIGEIPLDKDFIKELIQKTNVVQESIKGHREEHSLEIQLPFLQTVVDDFKLIPIMAGNAGQQDILELSAALSEMEQDFTVIASSDLSHFHSYRVAIKKDRDLIEKLQNFDIDDLVEAHQNRSLEACGMIPINVLMEYARKSGQAKFAELDYRNSGDTAGGRDRVVGYLSAALYE